MNGKGLFITPKTKLGELLREFPELEEVLLSISPAFARLKNPVLRKTVAQVATLHQVAAIAGLNVDELVKRLRSEVGQEGSDSETGNEQYITEILPEWFNPGGVTKHFDATPLINSGGNPMTEIMSLSKELKPGQSLELKTPFVPAPIIDIMRGKGFRVFSIRDGDAIISYFVRELADQ
jgi:hypothetical protein